MFLFFTLFFTANIASADSLDEVYIADSTLLLGPLTAGEITKLERARTREYNHIRRAYRNYSYPVWTAQMTLWFKHTYDSLKATGKDPWNYYYVCYIQYCASWDDYLRHRISLDDFCDILTQLPMVTHNRSLCFINPDY